MSDAMNDLTLAGCAPTPLSDYLKALGVLRLVVEQGADPDARGYWQGEQFVLRSRLDRARLERFLLEEYAPTPVLAPWNGGSGFYPKDNKKGIDPLRSAEAPRFRPIRRVIRLIDELLEKMQLKEKPEKEVKADFLRVLRADLPDEALDWLDAAVVLGGDNPKYPPLLGTGGNDGRLDFTNNYMQRLVDLFDPDSGAPTASAEAALSSALFGDTIPGVGASAIGQFSPGAAGGPNAATGFEGGALVNPWDFILMLEGAMLFASTTSRRLESGVPATASYPFTVIPTGSGSGASALVDESSSRAEIWMPLWHAPSSLAELKALLSEGRATLGRRTARDGLDFARAIAKVGVDRGIDAFQRYAFMMRSGKAYLATPLDRYKVRRNPRAELVDQLEAHGWLSRFRSRARGGANRVQMLVRRLEDAIFDLVTHPPVEGDAGMQSALRVQKVLLTLGGIQHYLATAPKLREEVGPVPRLSVDWVQAADDRSSDFRIAAALAGIHAGELPAGVYNLNGGRDTMPIGVHFAPVHPRDREQWYSESRLVTWGGGSLYENLAKVLQRRLIEAERLPLHEKPLFGGPPADRAAIAEFLAGLCNQERIASLLAGLVLCRSPRYLPWRDLTPYPLPLPYLLMKPLFVPDVQLREPEVGILPSDEYSRLPLPASICRLLAADRVRDAVQEAIRRRRGSGVRSPQLTESITGVDGKRLLAALMVPIKPADVGKLYTTTESLRRPGAAESTDEGQVLV